MASKYNLECAVWEFTLRCNLNCIHCGSSAGASREGELSPEEALRLCDDLKEAGCLSVALMGGEPFLRSDFWDVAGKIRRLRMDLSVITNGTVYDAGTFGRLSELSPRAVAVSVDGAVKATHEKIRGVTGCYERSWSFINEALKEKLPVSVITTVSKLNISELRPLAGQIKGRNIAWQIQTAGAEGVRFPAELLLDREEFYSVGMLIENLRETFGPEELPVIGAHDLGYNSRFLKNISLHKEWTGCQAGVSVLGIRSDGDILGCLAINNDKYVEGNAKKKKISEIWNGKKSFSYNRAFEVSDAGENCSACPHLEVCRGGCCEMSLMKTGGFHNDFYCFYNIEKEIYGKGSLLGTFFSGLPSKRGGKFSKIKKIFTGERKWFINAETLKKTSVPG